MYTQLHAVVYHSMRIINLSIQSIGSMHAVASYQNSIASSINIHIYIHIHNLHTYNNSEL